MTMVRMQTRTK